MKISAIITVKIEGDTDTLLRLIEAVETVGDVAEDMPWRPELVEAADSIREIARGFVIKERPVIKERGRR